MSRCLIWILGRGGLLGSHVRQWLEAHHPEFECWEGDAGPFVWDDPIQIGQQLEAAVKEFSRTLEADPRPWIAFWAAGAGVIGTTERALHAETDTWKLLLHLLDQHACNSMKRPGLIVLSSSAGGTFGNCTDRPLTENSDCAPISAYGRNKLRQEELLRLWGDAHPRADYLIARISNLYGPGQNMAKPQGLISQIVRCVIWQKPIQIFVPLDTIRDYLYAEDCGRQIVCSLKEWLTIGANAAAPRRRIKIFASEQTTSVAQVIAASSRLAPRYHPRVICAPSQIGAQQPRSLQFHSIAPPDLRHLRRTSLQVGINQVYLYQLALYRQARGQPRLPTPRSGPCGR